MLFLLNQCFGFKRYLQAAGSMLHVFIIIFILYVDNRLDDSMYRGVDDHFLEHPCAR